MLLSCTWAKRRVFSPEGFGENFKHLGRQCDKDQNHVLAQSSFIASGELSLLLKTFANNLDPDQARRFVGPDLDPNCFIL